MTTITSQIRGLFVLYDSFVPKMFFFVHFLFITSYSFVAAWPDYPLNCSTAAGKNKQSFKYKIFK